MISLDLYNIFKDHFTYLETVKNLSKPQVEDLLDGLWEIYDKKDDVEHKRLLAKVSLDKSVCRKVEILVANHCKNGRQSL